VVKDMKKHMSKIMLLLACLVIVASTTTVYARNNYDDEFVGDNFCHLKGTQAALNVVSWLILIAKMMIPIIIIIFGTLDLYKVVTSGEAGDVPKAAKSLAYRVVIGVFIFFLPTLTKAVIGYMLPQEYNTCAKCLLQPGACKDGSILQVNEDLKNNATDDSTSGGSVGKTSEHDLSEMHDAHR
jgi:hypothetical protein